MHYTTIRLNTFLARMFYKKVYFANFNYSCTKRKYVIPFYFRRYFNNRKKKKLNRCDIQKCRYSNDCKT